MLYNLYNVFVIYILEKDQNIGRNVDEIAINIKTIPERAHINY